LGGHARHASLAGGQGVDPVDEDSPRAGTGREELVVRGGRESSRSGQRGHLETTVKVLASLDALAGPTQGRAEADERSGELEASGRRLHHRGRLAKAFDALPATESQSEDGQSSAHCAGSGEPTGKHQLLLRQPAGSFTLAEG
jgi:hypothetical protein